jgi:hypothetical protein
MHQATALKTAATGSLTASTLSHSTVKVEVMAIK